MQAIKSKHTFLGTPMQKAKLRGKTRFGIMVGKRSLHERLVCQRLCQISNWPVLLNAGLSGAGFPTLLVVVSCSALRVVNGWPMARGAVFHVMGAKDRRGIVVPPSGARCLALIDVCAVVRVNKYIADK